LIRVESTAGEMRIGPREFAGVFTGAGVLRHDGASWFPQFPCWVSGLREKTEVSANL